MIKAIVFDLGNVLIPFDYSGLISKLNELKEGLGERFTQLYKTNYHVHRNFEKGLMNENSFLEIMLDWTEGVLSKYEFCRYYSEIFTENKSLTKLLPALKKNYKLILLSNTNSIHKKYGWDKFKFLKYFDKLILSHEVGAVKPEPMIYKAVMNFTKLPPECHLFIDDIKEYVEASKKIGWKAIQFKGTPDLLKEFKEIGII